MEGCEVRAGDDARRAQTSKSPHARGTATPPRRAGQPTEGLSLGGALAIGMLFGSALALLLAWRQSRQRQEAFREWLRNTGVIPEELLPALPDLAPESEEVDDALAARVHEVIASVATHPELIRASAARGNVILRGGVPVDELKPLLRAVAGAYGVQTVESQLTPWHEAASKRPPLADGTGEQP